MRPTVVEWNRPARRLACATLGFVILAAAPRESTFPSLVDAARRNPSATDFGALREAFTETAEYDPLFTLTDDYRRLRQEIRSGTGDRAISACANLPAAFFVSIDLHRDCAERLASLVRSEGAALHTHLADGLLASLTPADGGPIVVVHVEEEYDYVEGRGLEVLGHAKFKAIDEGGSTMEGLQVQDRDGKTSWIRFVKHPNYRHWQRHRIHEAVDDGEREER